MQRLIRNNLSVFFILLILVISLTACSSILQKKVTLQPGTSFLAILNSTVSSETSNLGDVVVATVNQYVSVEGKALILPGSMVYGKVALLEKASNEGTAKSGAISLTFDKLENPDGKSYFISASLPVQRAELTTQGYSAVVARTGREKFRSGAKDTILGAATGAALGTAVGAIAGGMPGRGAWSGAAIGGGLGATRGVYGAVNDRGKVVHGRKQVGQEITIKSGTVISITIDSPVQVLPQKS